MWGRRPSLSRRAVRITLAPDLPAPPPLAAGRRGLRANARFPFETQLDDILRLECALYAKDVFRTVVVLAGNVIQLAGAEVVAGEGLRRFADIGFGVMTDAEAEKLHQLAGIVFVRLALLA